MEGKNVVSFGVSTTFICYFVFYLHNCFIGAILSNFYIQLGFELGFGRTIADHFPSVGYYNQCN